MIGVKMYIVEKGDVGKRIDKYLSEKLNISRNRVALSQVFSNDKLVKPSYKVCLMYFMIFKHLNQFFMTSICLSYY